MLDGDKCPKCVEGSMEERIVWRQGEKMRILCCTWCGYSRQEAREQRRKDAAPGQSTLG